MSSVSKKADKLNISLSLTHSAGLSAGAVLILNHKALFNMTRDIVRLCGPSSLSVP